jgi:hypothetical protein
MLHASICNRFLQIKVERSPDLAAAVRETAELPGLDGMTLAEKAQQRAAYYLLIGLDALGIKLHRSHGHAGLLLKMACQVRKHAARPWSLCFHLSSWLCQRDPLRVFRTKKISTVQHAFNWCEVREACLHAADGAGHAQTQHAACCGQEGLRRR